ncbi:unnamed protein product, partial [Hapterophycus canaliculatus]
MRSVGEAPTSAPKDGHRLADKVCNKRRGSGVAFPDEASAGDLRPEIRKELERVHASQHCQ